MQSITDFLLLAFAAVGFSTVSIIIFVIIVFKFKDQLKGIK